jgi:hypothetical protein
MTYQQETYQVGDIVLVPFWDNDEPISEDLIKSKPQLLEIAHKQANATAQAVEFIFDSLIAGIERISPLHLDNTGLAIGDLVEVNEAHAASLGKAVDALTKTDRVNAVLFAVLRAGNAQSQERQS